MRRALLVAVVAAVMIAGFLAWRTRSASSATAGVGGSAPSAAHASRGAELADASPDRARTAATQTAQDAHAQPAKPRAWGERALEVRVVRDEDGSPLAGAVVTTTHDAATADDPRTTGADGIARWSRVDAQRWNVIASADGRASANAGARAMPGEPTTRVELRLALQRDVRVRLVDARGADVSPAVLGLDPDAAQGVGLALGAECGAPGERFDARGADAARSRPDSWNGKRFGWLLSIRGAGAGCVHVLLGDAVVVAEPLPAGARELAIPVDRAAFERVVTPLVVRVAAEAGRAPVEGAEVLVTRTYGAPRTLRTDADGTARIDGFTAGDCTVRATAPGFAPASVRASRPFADDVLVLLRPGHVVAGVVLDADGRSAAGVALSAYAGTDLGQVASPVGRTRSGPDGRFAFDPIAGVEILLCLDEFGIDRGYVPKRENLSKSSQIVDIRRDARDVVVQMGRPVDPHDLLGH